MLTESIMLAFGAYVFTAVVAMGVAGIIKIIFLAIKGRNNFDIDRGGVK
jgi:hypothetical protein